MQALRGALADVVEASREAIVLGEFAREALDGLRRAFDCNLGCITHSPYDGAIDIISCTDARVLSEYRRDWFQIDPINAALGSYDASWIVPATRLPEWTAMQNHPLYAEWAPSKNVRFLLHLRLSEAPYLKRGATNVFLCRPKEHADFSPWQTYNFELEWPDRRAISRKACSHKVLAHARRENPRGCERS